MYYRFMKLALTLGYLCLIGLTWKFFRGKLDWEFATGAVIISGFWLLLTRLQMRTLFRTYFDTLSRLQVFIPLWIGLSLSGLAVFASSDIGLRALSGLEFLWWGYIYMLYRRNRKKYINQGHGPLPKGAWVNPDPDSIRPGDLILTSGRIASRLQESVGHGEVAIRMPDGKIAAFSSYMEKGVVINDLHWLVSRWLARGEHYVVLRLASPLTDEQVERALKIAEQMRRSNDLWRQATNALRARLISLLPLPAAWRRWLTEKTQATGYDWPGLFAGTRAPNRWTCIGACLELYERLGIKTNKYGTGLLGLGTGLFDPIMPVRFLADRAFRLLSESDRLAFESGRNPEAGSAPPAVPAAPSR